MGGMGEDLHHTTRGSSSVASRRILFPQTGQARTSARGNGPEALPPEIADHRREEFVHLNVAAPMLDAYLLVVDPQTAPVLHHARLTSIRWCAPQVRTCVTSGWSTRRTRA